VSTGLHRCGHGRVQFHAGRVYVRSVVSSVVVWRTWLRERLGIPSREELSGLALAADDALEVPPPRDLARLIRGCSVMPIGSVLYLEDGIHTPDLAQFLAAHQVANPTKLAPGTIWPRPSVHHVPLEASTIDYLASYAETVAGPEVCIHLAVYHDDRVLVSAHDVPGDPVLVNRHLPEEIITAFAERLGFPREKVKAARYGG
jgi:hypothetical protein